MPQAPLDAIAHPTDFSEASAAAFAHALRLAVEFRCKLYLIHVRSPGEERASFPSVRETLTRWKLLPAGAAQADVEGKLGVKVRKVEVEHSDPLLGVSDFLAAHRPDLIVMATQGAEGVSRWLSGSVSEGIAHKTRIPALFIGPKSRPFVDARTGRMHLKNLMMPIARDPAPQRAIHHMHRLLGGLSFAERFVHVGDRAVELSAPGGERLDVALLQGPVVASIVSAANTGLADLLVMPTAGQQGFLDALRGSTTEQVIQRAPCPVLALPA
jgi:nucleotide-binding universal stress UspA family protein